MTQDSVNLEGLTSAPPARSVSDPLRQVTVSVIRWQGESTKTAVDELAAEEPLEIRAASPRRGAPEPVAVIMRTPGQDDELAAGFLFSEGLLVRREDLVAMTPGLDDDALPSPHLLDIATTARADIVARAKAGGYSRQFAVTSSCGVCGKNSVAAALDTLPPLPRDGFSMTPETLYRLPDLLREAQRVFAATGGLHAAALFDADGRLLALREDVGRHNAVDRLVGRAFLDGALPLANRALMVSGRLSFEIVLKALAAGIPLVAAVSAPSSLAVDLARAGGVTLAGFVRGERLNVYTGSERVRA
ncbi:MAG TPA: formate dehydrogenase accessory sulfurtransferase FdhD [Ktedonobacterales bacterium]